MATKPKHQPMAYLNKLVNWYFDRKSLPYWCIFLIDNAVVFCSFMLIFQQFHSGAEALAVLERLSVTVLLFTFLFAIGFRRFHTYSGIIRYSSFNDLKRVGYAMLLGFVLSEIAALLLAGSGYFVRFYPSHIGYATLLATVLLCGFRVMVKTVYDVSMKSSQTKYSYVYGTTSSAIGVAKHVRNEKPMRFDIHGFISPDGNVPHRLLMGEHIYAADDKLIPRMRNTGIEAVIVAQSETERFRKDEALQNMLINAGVHIYISQSAHEWNGETDFPAMDVKEVSVEDLLPRAEIQVDMDAVGQQLTGSVVMITGSAGSIGSELVNQVALFRPKKLLLVDQSETPQHDLKLLMARQFPQVDATVVVNTICDAAVMESLFSSYSPEYVFHAAAYKHVPMMEDNPTASVMNNIVGTKVLADMAVRYGTRKFVMISTDKAVNPTNVMGCSKRICEMYVQSLDASIKSGCCPIATADGQPPRTQFVTTRFGNVLGSNGSVIPLFREQIRNGGPVTVTDPNIIRYFMLIPEACKLVLEAGTKGKGGEIFVFDMGAPVRITDLARRMIQLSGASGIEIKYIGLRPGEKLYEEVLNLEETTKKSFHPKIRIANVVPCDYASVDRRIGQLVAVAGTCDAMRVVAKMKEMVPEYKSNNSVYEVLDR